jgi:hypothetical protein
MAENHFGKTGDSKTKKKPLVLAEYRKNKGHQEI